jgi:serine/threonine-protein kinase
MATVWCARDLRHDREVAIKVMHPELAASVGADRFLREIRLVARLQHPHILPLFDSGRGDGRVLWFAMPLVDGDTLRARPAARGRAPVRRGRCASSASSPTRSTTPTRAASCTAT